MPNPELLRQLQEAANRPGASPEMKARAQALLDQYAGPGGGPGGGGAMSGPGSAELEDPLEAAHRAKQALEFEQEQLPTATIPADPANRGRAPIYFEGNADQWKETMGRAEREGRPAYRADAEFPASTLEGAAMRAGRMAQSFGQGVAASATMGATPHADTPDSAAQRAALEEAAADYPVSNMVGRAVGTPLGVGRALSAGAQKLAGAAQGIANPVLRYLSAGALGGIAGAGAGAVQAGGEAAVAGRPVGEAAGAGALVGGPLGVFGGLAGELARGRVRSIRDPDNSRIGRDLNLAEGMGAETEMSLRGVKPGPEYDALLERARQGGGVQRPSQIAAQDAIDPLGRSVQRELARAPVQPEAPSQSARDAADWRAAERLGTLVQQGRDRTLPSIGMQNRAGYEQGGSVSFQRLVTKQLDTLRKATGNDGRPLPAQDIRGTVRQLRESADVQLVGRSSDAAQAADPENTIPAGLARAWGLVKGRGGPGDDDMVVVLTPRSGSRENVDTMVGGLSDLAKEKAASANRGTRSARQQAAAGREVRNEFGPEWAETKQRQALALQRMENAQQAAGLPKEAGDVDMGELGTRDALFQAVRRYRAEGNAIRDAELDRLAKNDPGLRAALDNAVALRAAPEELPLPQSAQNALAMTNLPANTRSVNLADDRTREALERAAAGFRGGNSGTQDQRLMELANASPEVRAALQRAAGAGAIERLKGIKVPVTPNGIGSYGLRDPINLRLDPLMRYLSTRSMIPSTAAANAARGRQK